VKRRLDDAAWMARNFPNADARRKADEAIDALDPHAPMSAYLDAWLAAYVSAGGQTRLSFH
jgi:hypothetical protein